MRACLSIWLERFRGSQKEDERGPSILSKHHASADGSRRRGGLGNVEPASAVSEFLNEIQTEVFRVFLLAIHSHLYSFALRFYFIKLTQPLMISRIQLLYTVKESGGKPDRKPYPPSLWLKKSIQKPHVWELSWLCPETSTKLYVHEFGFSHPIKWEEKRRPLLSVMRDNDWET